MTTPAARPDRRTTHRSPVQTAALLYGAVFLLYDTLFTIVNVPYLALVPELADSYDERSSLTGWRTAFSFLAQLATAGAFKLRNGAPVMVNNQVKVQPSMNPRPENR